MVAVAWYAEYERLQEGCVVNGGSLNGFQEILGMAGMAFCADESTITDRHKQHNAAHACSNTSINAQRKHRHSERERASYRRTQ
jgi:hypothetical protein